MCPLGRAISLCCLLPQTLAKGFHVCQKLPAEFSKISIKLLTIEINWRKPHPYLNCKSHIWGVFVPQGSKGTQAITKQSGVHYMGLLNEWNGCWKAGAPITLTTISFSGKLAQSCWALWWDHVQFCLQSWSPSGQLATGCQSPKTPGKKEKWVGMLQAAQPAASGISAQSLTTPPSPVISLLRPSLPPLEF